MDTLKRLVANAILDKVRELGGKTFEVGGTLYKMEAMAPIGLEVQFSVRTVAGPRFFGVKVIEHY